MTGRLAAVWIPVVILAGVSLLILNSLDPASAQTQALFFGVSFFIMYLVSKIDYHLYLFSPWPWYVTALILLVLTFLLGTTLRGSTRWLGFGSASLQTSEIIKPLFILYLSSWLAQKPPTHLKFLFTVLGVSLVPILFVFIQPDLGTSIVLIFLLGVMILASGAPLKHLFLMVGIAALTVPLIFTFLKPYQKDRITAFLHPETDPLGIGYNAAQATIAVGSGKLFGRGLGQGTQSHLRFLPERHTDFVFASLVEELGLAGGLIILGCYGLLTFSLFKIAQAASTDAGSLIVMGTLSILMLQALVNLGMNMSLFPITGITLPLVSAGGSSILSFCISLGLCLAVARARRPQPKILQIH